jgi:hypothetical protein
MIRGEMNVYNRATGWGTFVTLLLLAGVLILDVWIMDEVPILQHGVGYAMLQICMVGVVLTVLRLIFQGGSSSPKD